MCAPVLSLPRHNSAMFGMRDGATSWRGPSDGRYLMHQPLSPYGGGLGLMPQCPYGGFPQAAGSWGVADWGSGGGAAAPPILATSPSSSRKPGAAQRTGHQRPQSTAAPAATTTLIPGLQQWPYEGWEQQEISRPTELHHQRPKQRRSGPALIQPLSPRTSERDQLNKHVLAMWTQPRALSLHGSH